MIKRMVRALTFTLLVSSPLATIGCGDDDDDGDIFTKPDSGPNTDASGSTGTAAESTKGVRNARPISASSRGFTGQSVAEPTPCNAGVTCTPAEDSTL